MTKIKGLPHGEFNIEIHAVQFRAIFVTLMQVFNISD